MEKNELEKKVYDLQNILQNIDIKDTCENAAQVSQILNHSSGSLAKEKGRYSCINSINLLRNLIFRGTSYFRAGIVFSLRKCRTS